MDIMRITVVYPMVGDHTPQEWVDIVLGFHKEIGDILDYKYLESVGRDAHFSKNVHFSMDMEQPKDMTSAQIMGQTHDFVQRMLGEPDFEISHIEIYCKHDV